MHINYIWNKFKCKEWNSYWLFNSFKTSIYSSELCDSCVKTESGISVDNNKNIVFHSKTENFKTTANDLNNYELLIDNNPIISKNQSRKTAMNSFPDGCYSISLRITTTDKTTIIPILEQNSFGKKYNMHDSIYSSNITFSKKIMEKLDELCNEN